MKLTDIVLRNLRTPERGQTTYHDDTLRGFGVRVSQGGTKTFIVVHGVNRERTTLGRYPVITLSEARVKAKHLLAERTLGKERQQRSPFDEALELFITTHCRPKNKPRTAAETARLLNRHSLPPFRRMSLSDLSTTAVTKITDGLASTPSLANHAFTAARTYFRWAVKRRLIERSPLDGLGLPNKTVSRERVLTDEELACILAAARTLGSFGKIVQLLMLTGQRVNQIVSLRVDHIDQEAKTIRWSGDLMKGNRPHRIPLGEMAAVILGTLPKEGLVFSAKGKETPFNGFSTSKGKLDRLCKIEPWTLHDLRRTLATGMAKSGIPPHIVERLLDHRSGTISGVAAIYNRHAYIDEMRAALATWEKHIDSLTKTGYHAPMPGTQPGAVAMAP
jgi:integrase